MKTLKVRSLVVVFLLLSSILTVSVLISSPKPTASLVVEPERAWRQQPPTLPENLYAQAAKALRQGNLQAARQNLDAVAARHPEQAAQAQVVAGLYAHEAGQTELAGQILSSASAPGGPLEDWRLYLLARDAARRGDGDLARATYARLIAETPDSPLRPLAFLESAELAADHGQPRLALDLIAGARQAGIGGQAAEDLESLAWKIGRNLEDEQVQREAGRRLLVSDPLSSEAMQVVRTFRALDGDLDWNRLLSSPEILRRAESFLDGGSARAAISTLEEIPEEERGFEWHLLKARALVKGEDGHEALAVLATLLPSTPEERNALEWVRVLATAEAGDPEAASVYLAKLTRSQSGPEISRDSLRRLYKDFREAGLFEPALETLRLLRRVDPADETGAADLWELGWAQYQAGNAAGAVGYWTELVELYPDDGDAQRGRYWKARTLEDLGQPERAREIYRDLVASSDTSDFYGRQAMARLGEIPPAENEGMALAQAPAGEWPAEPALRRAKLLSDLGLDELASEEIELVADRSNRRDVLALKGLILCRKGEQRSGIVLLREAFPALGGPNQSSVPAEVLFAYYPLDYGDQIRACARETGLPGHIIAGIIRQESAFDPRATSPVGARGLMQLMPETAREVSRKVGVPYAPERLYEPDVSVRLGATYFRELLDRFDGNVELALASYNGGPNRIQRLWKESGHPDAELADFVETLNLDESRDYVKRILVLADSYRQLYPSLG
ncbi:MAG TPA: transglycosylase SLT domain-containing protein [Thermoanaerobaculia bacterium]|jgi:soluble lytic murein transglycosylase|nr:transglycosylase SLT domain-containing protein [Thermoanaerobaculia bacterium]